MHRRGQELRDADADKGNKFEVFGNHENGHGTNDKNYLVHSLCPWIGSDADDFGYLPGKK